MTSADEAAAEAARPGDNARQAEREADEALSYLDKAARSEQRLGKYLNSEAIMPKLHKVLADAGIGSRREMEELIVDGVYASRRQMPLVLRTMLDFLVERLGQAPWDAPLAGRK
jgi:hypothetical protein